MSTDSQSFLPRARVLVYGDCGNIGDAVQTVALTRLLGGATAGVWRDAPMSDLHSDVPFVVNGWLGKGTPLPDSNCLFAGFHLGYREPDYISWIRQSKYPVGARDPFTRELLAANGIASTLVGCATLTLPRYRGPRHGRYSIDVEQVAGTTFETSMIPDLSWKDQWELALHRLDQLRSAELVYTRRLHVVLPCLAFGTPVVFPLKEFRDLSDKSRLGLLHSLGFVYDEAVELDVTSFADTFIGFLSGALGEPIEPIDVPVMPVPIMPPPEEGAQQLEESLDTKVIANLARAATISVGRPTPTISCLLFSKNGARLLPECLESIRQAGFVSEIVVCVDTDSSDASVDVARRYTPDVYLAPSGYPETGTKLAQGVALCHGDFVLRMDDDERLGGDWNRERFEWLVRFNDLTHFWVPRRWIVEPGDRFIASPPWSEDILMRIFLNDPRLLSFPKRIHENLRVTGRSLVLYDRWLDHHVLAMFSREEREAKSRTYAKLRPEHHLSEFYLHEGVDLRLAPLDRSPLSVATRPTGGPHRFRARTPYAPGSVIDFTTGGNAAAFTLKGWSSAEEWGTWTVDEEAGVWLPLEETLDEGATLVAVVRGFVKPGHPVCRAQVLYRGDVVDQWSLVSPDPAERRIAISSSRIARDFAPAFTIRILNPMSPFDLKESSDHRRLGLGFTSLKLVPGNGTPAPQLARPSDE